MESSHRVGVFPWIALVVFICFFAPSVSRADFQITFEPTFSATVGDTTLYNGNLDDPLTWPPAVTIRASDFDGAQTTWEIEQLVPGFFSHPDVSEDRGAFILARIDSETHDLEGGAAVRGTNYDFVHAAWSTSATTTTDAAFTLPAIGNPDTPSGTYRLFFAMLPESKLVYDPETDTESEFPFTDNDMGLIFVPDDNTYAPVTLSDSVEFEYVDDVDGCTEQCYSNVLFLPGIMGTRLYDNGEQLWDGNDEQVQRLYLDESGTSESEDIYAKGVIDVFTAAPVDVAIYESFLGDLAEKKADGTIENYAAVPYDWRLAISDILENGKEESPGAVYYSRATSTPYIEQELRMLAADSRTGKVTIVAHSNGGLVAKALLSQLGAEASELVDRLILVGVPQIGTPKAVGALLHGFDTGIPFVLSDERARDFANTAPLIYQLLPDSDYYQNAGASITTPLVTFEAGAATQAYVDAYGIAVGNAEELHSFLIGEEGRTQPTYDDTASPAVGRESILNAAEELKELIGSSWLPPAGVTVHQIAGIGENTLAGITYKTVRECTNVVISSGRPICTSYEDRISYTPNEVIDGDGTVVVPSALAMSESENIKRWWINLDKNNDDNSRFWFFRLDHKNILEVTELRNFIFDNLLQGSTANLPAYISDELPQLTSDNRMRFILHSPLALSATDSSGNTISANVATISGATYAQYGDVQVITVPSGSNTTVSLNGISAGTFTLEVEEYDGGALVDSATFSGVPSGANTEATFTLPTGSLASAGDLVIDYDGDGTADVELPAGELVSYEELVTEENEDEDEEIQNNSGGGTVVGLIVAQNASTSPTTIAPETLIVLATSSEEVSLPEEVLATTSPIRKTVVAIVAKPVISPQEAELDIIELVVEQSQVAAAADAAAWYDVLINKVNEFFVDLYQWLKSWI